MSYDAILFDLDGTLLPMDNDEFTRFYFKFLCKDAYEWGYHDSELLIGAIWKGVGAMVANDGSRSNSAAFWETFKKLTGRDDPEDEGRFKGFYSDRFNLAKEATGPAPLAGEAVRLAKEKADLVILATNPIFPECADETRLSWLGLSCSDFELVTDYDNSNFCKPNPEYFREVLRKFDLDPRKCLMVGNDVDEDIYPATEVGMDCFLVRDTMINKSGRTYDCPNGTYADMVEYLRKI